MKILFIFFISISLYANSLLTNYRLNGIEHIEQQMDFELTKKEYWSEYLKDKDTLFGFIEAHSSLLTCNKEASTLSLYKKNGSNKFEFVKDYNAFTGRIQGDKSHEGDLKTPIGIYELTEKISKLDQFYGPLAFVTSYPNIYDTYRGKNGSGIWIHGLPTEQERDEYTKGCIAINNENIECLDKRINVSETLLIINKSNIPQNISKDTLASILSQLFAWRHAWLYNDLDKYLDFYASDFIRIDGMGYNRFTTYKTRIFAKNEKKTIIFSDINILPYPSIKDTYQITFKENYLSNSFKFVGNKTLMIRIDATNKIKIFTEK
ncbi:L,D-transpeptidase family protein [bacterium]|nr:L,D-transpeptidase family protein [bacterium]MBU1994622.1 L,D-transpeptidase family protein [bacterium]